MKTIYTVNVTYVSNPTLKDTSSFFSEDLAKKVKEELIKRNNLINNPVAIEITESTLYEDIAEIPILN